MDKVMNELLKSIDIMIQKRLAKLKITRYMDGVITAVNNDIYTVQINDTQYEMKAKYNQVFEVGNLVLVLIPNGDITRKVIDSIR